MRTSEVVEDILAHHGVKGQKWGVRRRSTGAQGVTVSDKRKKLKTSGGKGFPAHADAVRSRTIGQVGKKSGTKALSNAELRAYNDRLNMEQNFKRLSYHDKPLAQRFVLKILGQAGQQQASEVTNKVASRQVGRVMKRASAVGFA